MRRGALRRVKTISEIAEQDQVSDEIVVNNAYTWNPVTDSHNYAGFSYALKRIAEKEGKYESELEREVVERSRILERMIENDVNNHKEFYNLINLFYKDRNRLYQALDMKEKLPA